MAMAFAFTSNRHGWDSFRRAVRAVPSPVVQGMMAAAVLCALVPAMAGTFHLAAWLAAPPRVAAPLPAADITTPVPERCPGCGVVEGIRLLEPGDDSTATYEFAVRMHDGTLRTSTTTGRASWRVGDRILLLGGSSDR